MTFVKTLDSIDRTDLPDVGGKGASLGELMRIDGIRVPDGFCVTTDAFVRAVDLAPGVADLVERLQHAGHDDVAEFSARVRQAIEEAPMPADVADTISASLRRFDEGTAFAVRSSATAEDLPGASFAGQHDSYLGVVGLPAVLQHVRRCWASLFSERAVAYRRHHGFGDREVRMAVVVQREVEAQAAGVLFTADPVNSNRRVATVEATRGLGEALVSGLVDGDVYRVRDDTLVDARTDDPERPVLTGDQVRRLVHLGRRIETHFKRPQDIEWCIAGNDADGITFVQSRPITTLFPVPETDDDAHRVYLSVGHQQMMTDAMTPLGLSFWQLTTPAPMAEAGGRLFVDVTSRLASPTSRAGLLDLIGKADPLTANALRSILERGFIASLPEDAAAAAPITGPPPALGADPAVVTELIARSEASVAEAARSIAGLSGEALLDFILADLQELRHILFDPRSHQVYMSAMEASWWIDEHARLWLGETGTADVLTRSVPHNVTSQMGLALLDVADAIRPHPQVVAYLRDVADEPSAHDLLAGLGSLAGGCAAREAIEAWLDRYGMRCAGEIDITRTRWRERPAFLAPVIVGNVDNAELGAGTQRFEQGLRDATACELDLLRRVRALPDGEQRAEQMKQMIDRLRTFIGYREYPKYGMVSRYFVYKQALMAEAARLVSAGALREPDDLFFLSFGELRDVVCTGRSDAALIDERRVAHATFSSLTAPRVLTSEGESVTGAYPRGDLPPGVLLGLAASAGVVEGRARIATDMANTVLERGDILITRFTDPSWTPLFLTAAGLITEVGGLMTHGAVVAREYGLPAVVGLDGATTLIRDGQRIRLDGATGRIELLD